MVQCMESSAVVFMQEEIVAGGQEAKLGETGSSHTGQKPLK